MECLPYRAIFPCHFYQRVFYFYCFFPVNFSILRMPLLILYRTELVPSVPAVDTSVFLDMNMTWIFFKHISGSGSGICLRPLRTAVVRHLSDSQTRPHYCGLPRCLSHSLLPPMYQHIVYNWEVASLFAEGIFSLCWIQDLVGKSRYFTKGKQVFFLWFKYLLECFE